MEYIQSLQSPGTEKEDTAREESSGSSTIEHVKYDPASGKEEYETAGNLKQEAADANAAGDHAKALDLYNQAVLAAPPSALLYANRAMLLEKLGHYPEAAQDCTWALELNPDSAKALKVRGKLRHLHLGDWHGALQDLNLAQTIDFDPDVAQVLKELTELRKQEELNQAQERIQQEETKRKKAEAIKKAQQEAKREQETNSTSTSRSTTGSPGGMGGMPGGMGGMPGMDPSMMAGLMSDPELQEAMKNPKVVAAFNDLMSGPGGPMGLMSNPAKLQQLMTDPDVGPVLQKLMGKFMGGAGGGAGGMGSRSSPFGGGGAPGGASGGSGGEDDIPDLGEMPDLE